MLFIYLTVSYSGSLIEVRLQSAYQIPFEIHTKIKITNLEEVLLSDMGKSRDKTGNTHKARLQIIMC